jgi:intermediate cleaving peptidase 55
VLNSLRSEATDKDFSDLIASNKLKPLRPLVHGLRAFKSEAEIALLRQIGRATGRSFQDSMKNKWNFERDLMAFFEYRLRMHGCEGNAYVPIVAGGKNALIKHYTRNDDVMKQEDLLFVDAGGEIGHYIADVTRVWPNNGKFSDAQRDLYEAVLSAQRSCVSLCRASSNLSLDQLHNVAYNAVRDNLKSLGFNMSGNVSLFVSLSVGFPFLTIYRT